MINLIHDTNFKNNVSNGMKLELGKIWILAGIRNATDLKIYNTSVYKNM